jgi:hypothetical protein
LKEVDGRVKEPRSDILPAVAEQAPQHLGCYSLGDDQLWGVTRLRKGGDHPWAP